MARRRNDEPGGNMPSVKLGLAATGVAKVGGGSHTPLYLVAARDGPGRLERESGKGE